MTLSEGDRDRYRREAVGYAWQEAGRNFMAEMTVEENLQIPMVAARVPAGSRRQRATDLLMAFGLEHRRQARPSDLSGGEQRLLAVAVAMANRPRVLLADEPTAGLDRATGAAVLTTLSETRRRDATTVVFVTHEQRAERYVDRVLRIRDGRTSTETRGDTGERVIVDRTGRLQLPRHLIDEIGLGGLAHVRREGRGILVEPEHDGHTDG